MFEFRQQSVHSLLLRLRHDHCHLNCVNKMISLGLRQSIGKGEKIRIMGHPEIFSLSCSRPHHSKRSTPFFPLALQIYAAKRRYCLSQNSSAAPRKQPQPRWSHFWKKKSSHLTLSNMKHGSSFQKEFHSCSRPS